MSLILYAGLAFAFAGAAVVVRRREHIAGAIGLIGLVVAVAAAISIVPGQTFAIGDGGLVTTPYLAVWYLAWTVPLVAAEEDRAATVACVALCVYLLPQTIPA